MIPRIIAPPVDSNSGSSIVEVPNSPYTSPQVRLRSFA